MGFTRRRFVTRAGLAVAAAGLWRLPIATVPQLHPSRRRTYMALVEAVGRATRSQVDPHRTAFAADWLPRHHHATALTPTREAIDDTLDRIEAAPAPRRAFSRLDRKARIALLRELTSTDPELAARAVALAAAPFHPPAGDYHPTPVVL
jgi:hypothetical protein